MSTDGRDMLARLLKQSILTMCKEAVQYETRLEIDGLICISTENDSHQIVLKIHELFHKLPRQSLLSTLFVGEQQNFIVKQQEKKPHINYPQPDTAAMIGAESNNDVSLTETNYPKDESDSTADDGDVTDTSVSPVNVLKGGIFSETTAFATSDDNRSVELNYRDTTPTGFCGAEPNEKRTVSKSDLPAIHDVKISSRTASSEKPSQNIHKSNLQLNAKLKPSALQNIHCKKCDEVLENGTAFEEHNANVHSVYTCFVCLNTFTSRNNMNRHIRIHSGARPYACPKCPEKFTRKDDVKRHLLRHDYDKPYRCALCCKGYSEKIGVRTHIVKEHGSKEFYSCPQCGKCFCDFDIFQLHKKSHSEFKQFSCNLCNFTGSNSLMYSKHMLSHDCNKKYTCAHCNSGVDYKDPFLYTAHLKTHRSDPLVTTFKCCFCEASLVSYDLFVRHEHSHVHGKKHVCNVCGKKFEWAFNLKEHMLTHVPEQENILPTGPSEMESAAVHGKKPVCNICGKTFERTFDLKEHMLTHVAEQENVLPKGPSEMEGIDEEKEKEFLKDEDSPRDDKGSVDYWCAECNEGFATEHKLESHILETHEREEGISSDKVEDSSEISRKYLTQVLESHQRQLGNLETRSSARMEMTRQFEEFQKHMLSFDTAHNERNNEKPTKTHQSNKTSDRLDLNVHGAVNLPRMPLFRNKIQEKSPRSKLPKLYHLIVDQNDSELGTGDIKTEKADKDYRDANQNNIYNDHLNVGAIKTEKMDDDDINHSDSGAQDSLNSLKLMGTPQGTNASTYSSSSVLGMCTEFSSVENRSMLSTASLKMKVRPPGFEKVVTPDILFRTKASFTCEDCNEVFTDFTSFDQHGTNVHHSFICGYCGKVFTAKPNRERHVRYHTGEKPYRCELCEESFFRGDDLKYHRTAKHGDVRPYACSGCPRTFIWNKDLLKHLRHYPHHTKSDQ